MRARREAVSEELRVLYVALTRAKEKLIITAAGARLEKDLQKWATLAQMDRLPPYALSRMRSTLPWLLLPLLRHPAGDALRQMAGFDGLPDLDAPDVFDIQVVTPEALEAGATQADANQIEEERPVVNTRLDYAHPYLQDIPAKLTATRCV